MSHPHAMFGKKMGNQVEPSVTLHVTPRRTSRETPEIEICVTPQETPEKNSQYV